MFLSEMFNANNGAFQDLSHDDSVEKPKDLRKTRLTLAQINQLRKMNDQRTVEYIDKMKLVRQQYGAPPANAQPGL
jgi:predicted DNA-binding ArsR family transcriptional regulator